MYRTLFAGGVLPSASDISVVFCSWDGSTFFFDQEGRVMQFLLKEEVSSFAVGRYGSGHQACLVYAVMGRGIRVYPNVKLPAVE